METHKLAIVGASYLQAPLIERAKDMGFETHVFAWAANDVGETIASEFHPIDIRETGAILNECRQIGIEGICTIASDLAAITVGYVAENLGLVGNPWKSISATTNKHTMRETFHLHGDPSPRSYLVDETIDFKNLDFDFPAIVKPTDRSGSRGVTKIAKVSEIPDAIRKAVAQSFEGKAVLEEFITGEEFSVECISYQGKHRVLAITKKYTTGSPHFIEIAHEEPAPLPPVTSFEQIALVVMHALDSLDIKNGASHAEVMISDSGAISIIEVGARMGGDCIGSHLVELSTGIDYIGNVIRIAVGQSPDLDSPRVEKRFAAVRYIIVPKDRRLLRTAQNDENVTLEYVSTDMTKSVPMVTDSSTRSGCFVVSAGSREDLLPYLL